MVMIDIVIVVIIALSACVGMIRGFIRELLSLTSWLLALWVAYTFFLEGALYFEPHIQQQSLRYIAAFAVIFVASLLLISVLSHILCRILLVAGISGVDRSLGILFGLLRGALVISLLILLGGFMDFNTQLWWRESSLVELFNPITDFIISLLPLELASYVSAAIR